MRLSGCLLLGLLWGVYLLRLFVLTDDAAGIPNQTAWIYNVSHYLIEYPSWYLAHFIIPPDAEFAAVLHKIATGAWVVLLSLVIYIFSYKSKKL